MGEGPKRISRREFLKLAGAGTAALAMSRFRIGKAEGEKTSTETEGEPLSRKEHFKPFNKGYLEWQYVEFQYKNNQGECIGITTSLSELTGPITGNKTQRLLVMRHNVDTENTQKNIYEDGTRSFDEATSTYTFTDEDGEKLAEFSYNEAGDNYKLKINTQEFNSDEIDSEGLILNPQGNLMPVSKDGNFTVASYEGGRIVTNYFADHIRVEKQSGEIMGYGRRDSENLELEGSRPSRLDIDHTWVHISGDLEDGRQVYITAWASKSGGDYKFADITVINPTTGTVEIMVQLNEEDGGFSLDFKPEQKELETPPDQAEEPEYQMAHGGKIIAELNGNNLFELEIDGNPGQVIDCKSMFNMVEAHGKLVSGSVAGVAINKGNSAIWETTDERYSNYLPLILSSK